MSELIMRKLSILPVGTHVSLTYVVGMSAHETVSGVVTDNNFHDGIEILTGDGQELLLAYGEISRLLIQKKADGAAAPAANANAAAPAPSQNAPPALQEEFLPIRRELASPVPALNDKELKALFDRLPRSDRRKLNGSYDSFKYGIKCTDRSKMATAAKTAEKTLLDERMRGYVWSMEASRFCGVLLSRAGVNRPEMFLLGKWYREAALCFYKAEAFTEAAACAALALAEAQPEQEDDLWALLASASLKRRDVSAFSFLRERVPERLKKRQKALFALFFSELGVRAGEESNPERAFSRLESLCPNRSVIETALRLLSGQSVTPEAGASGAADSDAPTPCVGWLGRLNWGNQTGEVHCGDQVYLFQYQDVSDAVLRRAVTDCPTPVMGAENRWVRFLLTKDGKPTRMEGLESPLERARQMARNYHFEEAVALCQQLSGSPDAKDAMGEMVQYALEKYKTDNEVEDLADAEEFYRAHQEEYPNDAWHVSMLGQLYYYLRDLATALDYMRQALEFPRLSPKLRATFLAHSMRYGVHYYDMQPDPEVMQTVRSRAEEWLNLYRNTSLSVDMNTRRYYPRILQWKSRAEIALELPDEADQDLKELTEVFPHDIQLPELRAAVRDLRRRLKQEEAPPAAPAETPPPEEAETREPDAPPPAAPVEAPPPEEVRNAPAPPPPKLEEEEELEKVVPYEDQDGWNALGLSKRDAVDYAVSLSGPSAIPAALAYLKAASTLNPEILPVYHAVSLAANDPMAAPDYSINTLASTLEESDPDYPQLSDCCMAAAFLRSSFLSGRGYDYNAKALRDSISVTHEIPALGRAFDTLEEFRTAAGRAIDLYAGYRNAGAEKLKVELEAVERHAEELYTKFVVNPRESARFERFLETRRIVFAKDGYFASMLQNIISRDQDAMEGAKDAFAAQYLGGADRFSARQISVEQIDRIIAESWEQAAKNLQIKRGNTALQGDRRNNLRSNLSEVLDVICQWYAVSEQSAGAAWRTEAGEAAYHRLYPQLSEQLGRISETCGMLRMESDSAEYRMGLTLLSAAASELTARLEGFWRFGEEKYLYTDFLNSDQILLDTDFLPDLSSTFCALSEFNVLARIRAHVEGPKLDFQAHLDQIYGPDQTRNNYGTAERIVSYLEHEGKAESVSVPEHAAQFAAQSELQARMGFRSFLESYALARNYGQIMQSDAFSYHLEDTVRYWYAESLRTKNFGFFASILHQAERQVHSSARQYGQQLEEQLDALINGNREQFDSHPGYAEAIRTQIEQQNFIVAEDWMHRIRLGDFSLDVQQPEALECLDQFWNSYAEIYQRVADSSRALGSLVSRHLHNQAAKDIKRAQQMMDCWLRNGNPSTPARMGQLLNLLGWQNIEVEAFPFPADAKAEVYRVTREAKAAGLAAPLHPIAAFGSRLDREGMYAACLYGTYDCDRLYEKIRALDAVDGSKLVFLDYALGGVERRALARKLKQKESGLRNVYLVIDRVLITFLASSYSENLINRRLMAAGIPFSYCQPYVVESSHTMPPEIFIGRKDELLKIEQPDGVNLIYGGRQLGKSALFKKARGDLDGSQNRRAVLVDVKDCGCADAARRLSMELTELGILPETAVTDDWGTLCHAIRQRLRGQDDIRYLLVMMDEADDFIADCGAYNYKPLADLKDIQQTLPGQFKFVLAGLHNIVRFNREVALGRNSVITHLPSLKITPFRTPEAQELLTGPLSYLGLSLPSKVTVSQILATVNYFPGLIQLYCQKLIESLRTPDYAGYDVKKTPPYIITDDHLRRVMADREFVEQIHEKFEITLRLDQDQGGSYYPLTLLIGLMYTEEPSQEGYTAKDVLRHAEDLGVTPLTNLGEEKIDALMRELQDLNILRGMRDDAYLLASKNFRDLLGSDEEIVEKLLKVAEAGK